MLRPPQSLIAALAATTVVVTVAVCWAGWRLLDQQRAIDEQRARDQLDSSADAIASRISRRLAETGEWLSGWVASPASLPPAVDGAVALAVDADGIRIVPDGGLPFVPAVVPPLRPADAFAAAERLEFVENRPADAAARYRLLAKSDDAERRAGALLRLGRVLRKQGDFTGALTTYRQLAALGAARVHDLPAELAGLAGQRAVYAAVGEQRQLVAGDSLTRYLVADWTPDGRHLVYGAKGRDTDEPASAWVVPADGSGAPVRVRTDVPGVPEQSVSSSGLFFTFYEDWQWTPDGSAAVFTVNTVAGQGWIMENFLSKRSAARDP